MKIFSMGGVLRSLFLFTLFFLLFFFGFNKLTHASIVFNNGSNSGSFSLVSSFSWSHTITSSTDRLLAVGIALRDSSSTDRAVTSVSFGGITLTKARTDERAQSGLQTSVWYLVNPPVGASTIFVTLAGINSDAIGFATSFSGIDQTNPTDSQSGQAYGPQGSISTNINIPSSNAMVLDFVLMHGNQNLTIGSGQTVVQSIYNVPVGDIGMSTKPQISYGTTSMQWGDGGLAGNPLWVHGLVAFRSSSSTPPLIDLIPPTISMTAPTELATVSGNTVIVSAGASDDIGVVGVQFKLDGLNLEAEDTTYPYSISWDTTQVLSGNHVLSALARDASGNIGSSSIVNIVVNNEPMIPLTDMGSSGTYLGFSGGLYEDGTNFLPSDHDVAGLNASAAITPRDINGNPNPAGKVILMSVGVSLTTQEWCTQSPEATSTPCSPWTFTGQALATSSVNKTTLEIVNGALGAQTSIKWDQAFGADPDVGSLRLGSSVYTNNYDRINGSILIPKGLSEAQVQVIWLQAPNGPVYTSSFPSVSADSYQLEITHGNILRALKMRYPNLQQVFISSPAYGGYSIYSGEPYFYENGFSMKWIIQAQIDQMRNAGTVIDTRAGDLDYSSGVSPWIAWGPYLWADGLNPRSDGLTWALNEYQSDGVHPSTAGETKVGKMLLDFFLNSSYTGSWFRTAPDVEAPSVPTNFSALPISSTQINLNWTTSSDNVGVSGYKIFRDSFQIATTTGMSAFYSDFGLIASTTYSYQVQAYDLEGNTSGFSLSAEATTQPQDPVFAIPILEWRFNESIGQLAGDSSGNNRTGILGSATSVDANDPAWVASGKFGSALLFDGVNDYVQITDTGGFDGPALTQLTVNAWVNLNAVVKNRAVVSKSPTSFSLLNGGLTNSWQFVAGGGTACNVEVPNVATTGSWHMITATFIGGFECRLYLDGSQIGFTDITAIPASIPNTTGSVFVGTNGAISGYQNSKIDEVRIYNTALSPSEVLSLYNL